MAIEWCSNCGETHDKNYLCVFAKIVCKSCGMKSFMPYDALMMGLKDVYCGCGKNTLESAGIWDWEKDGQIPKDLKHLKIPKIN